MKQEELFKVYAYAEILWNTFKKESGNEKSLMQNKMWYDFLKPYDIEIIFASMRELSKESDFCNIGKIAKGCQTICDLQKHQTDEEDEIFNEIRKAISSYNTNERFERLSPIAKRVVGFAGQLGAWAISDINDFNTVISSNIKRSIRCQLEKEKQIQSIGIETFDRINNKMLNSEEKKLIEIKKN